jgi:hypothetical protein
MAKLSVHGQEIGRITTLTGIKAYFEDGKILKNIGFGWKLHAKVKQGISPFTAYENALNRQIANLKSKPALAEYKKALHALAGINKRWKLHQTITLMPEDCDGVWSECCDGYSDNVHADIDEIAELCQLYLAAIEEGKAQKVKSDDEMLKAYGLAV